MREKDMNAKERARRRRAAKGFSLIELLCVVAVIATMAAITIPPFAATRRVFRTVGVIREVTSYLRDTRQMAVSQRRAFTFEYDDKKKQVRIINHGTDAAGIGRSGVTLLKDAKFPDNTGSWVARAYLLTDGGLAKDEIGYGLPSKVVDQVTDPQTKKVTTDLTALCDLTSLTPLVNDKVSVTFQPDGTVIDSTGAVRNVALYIYNTNKPEDTAMALSILGGTGRIKAWRYSSSAKSYVE
jgi:prepilin-type N-terminal cleavage/methylation domain-containing protein